MQTDFLTTPVRAAAILTTGYVAGTVIDNAYGYNQLDILWKFTLGSLTSGELKVEFSIDNGTSYYQDTNAAVSAGTTTVTLNEYTQTATGNYRISIPISARLVKISAKGTGTVTSSSCKIDAVLHTV